MRSTAMPSVNLYQIPQVINTTQSGGVGVNSATNKIDFDVSKNVTTEIEFLLKDIDRKAVSLTGKTMVIYIVDSKNNTIMLQKKLTVMNAPRGHCRLTISPSDIMDWSNGYYSYSITLLQDGKQTLVHQDINRAQHGFLEVKQGPLPGPRSAVVITPEEMQLDNNDLGLFRKYISGAYPGAAQRDNRVGIHSAAIYAKNMSGSFYVQASLEDSVPTAPQEWFDVEINNKDAINAKFEFENFTGVHNIQFQGSFVWVRFVFVPIVDELSVNSAEQSTKLTQITKILFKN
jgi:hypothetical protein